MSTTGGLDAATRAAYSGRTYTSTSANGASGLGEGDFYTLLVTQLRNQNPLEPMSNEDYIAQLAQFSSLAQLGTINDNLTYLQMYQASVNNTLAVSLVGKEVKVGTSELELKNGACNTGWYSLGTDAAEVKIRISDADGTPVKDIQMGSLEAGEYTFDWDGTDTNGNKVSSGVYTFEVIATNVEGESVSATYGIRSRVTGISFEAGITYLLLNGQKVPLSEISEIYEAGAAKDDDEDTESGQTTSSTGATESNIGLIRTLTGMLGIDSTNRPTTSTGGTVR